MPRSTQRKLAVLAVAVYYGVLAVASHGLHDWVGCADGHCGAAQVAAQEPAGCCHDCGHDHAAPAPRGGVSDEQSFRSYAAGHDAAHCAVCAWVAKLKTSAPSVAIATVVVQSIEPAADAAPSFVPDATPLTHEARGPPALRA